MTQVARLGTVSAKLTTGAFGHDPTEVTDDLPEPPDRAPDSHTEVPRSVSGGTISVLQTKSQYNTSTGSGSITMPSPVTAGSALFVIIGRDVVSASIAVPSGFALLASRDNTSAQAKGLIVCGKVADGTEQTVTLPGSPKAALYLEVDGFGGVLPDIADVATDEFDSVDHAVVPAVSLAGGIAAFVLATIWKKTDGPNPGPASLSGYTTGPDTGYHGIGGLYRVTAWYVATNSSSTSYGGGTVSFTPSSTPSGCTINIAFTQGDTIWVPAPAVNDVDDATYDEVDAAYTEVLHVDMGEPFRLAGARLLIGSSTAGSATYSIEGANEADFSDAVTLDSQTFTAAGSFATNEVLFTFPATTAYQYYRLIGPGDDIRIYTLELTEPQPVTEHEALQGRSDPEQHPADAVTYDNGYSGLLATDVQAALDELSMTGGGGGAIELQEDGVTRTATMATLNVRHGLDADASGNVDVDEGELAHGSLGGLTTGDPHTQYRLETDDHSHASTGLQGGLVAHSALTGLTTGDPHTQYALDSDVTAEASTRAAADTALAAPDYLVGTATGTLSGEIVAGTTPGGELGGTWGSPTVDATHAGSTHVALSSATPVADGGAGAAGSGTASSKDDHKHPGEVVAIVVVIDGGGAAITTGVKGDVSVPFACTITGVRLLADVAGAIVVDIWKDVYSSYPPVVGDSITASAKPTISATNDHSEDTTLTGWGAGKTITAGDTLRFNVDSCTTITRVTLTLKATRD